MLGPPREVSCRRCGGFALEVLGLVRRGPEWLVKHPGYRVELCCELCYLDAIAAGRVVLSLSMQERLRERGLPIPARAK